MSPRETLTNFGIVVGYSAGEYYPDITCDYVVTAPEGFMIELSMTGDVDSSGCDNNITVFPSKSWINFRSQRGNIGVNREHKKHFSPVFALWGVTWETNNSCGVIVAFWAVNIAFTVCQGHFHSFSVLLFQEIRQKEAPWWTGATSSGMPLCSCPTPDPSPSDTKQDSEASLPTTKDSLPISPQVNMMSPEQKLFTFPKISSAR